MIKGKDTRWILVLLSFLWIPGGLFAQFGINFKYNKQDLDNLASYFPVSESESFLDQSIEIGIDYWFRLKNHRLEFYPEIAFSSSRTTFRDFNPLYVDQRAFLLFLNTRLYPFDFFEDCDCPTFSKQGNWWTKGFYFFLSPGLTFHQYQTDQPEVNSDNLTWNIGVGLGLDIGLNDLITLSPNIAYRTYGKEKWEALQRILNREIEDFSLSQWQIGIRLGMRFDYPSSRRF